MPVSARWGRVAETNARRPLRLSAPNSSATMAVEGVLAASQKAKNPEIDVYRDGFTPLLSFPESEKKLNDDL